MKIIRLLGLTALLAALAMSIRLNVLLYQEASGNYNDLNRVRLDPLGLSVFADKPPPPPLAARVHRAVFFGDSRAAEWTSPEVAGVSFLNRGIGAQTTAQVLGRFGQDVAPLQPHTLIIQVGVNDLKTVTLFPDRAPAIIQHTKDNIREIVRLALAAGVQQVILTTIFPVGDVPLERKMMWSDAIPAAIDEVNAYLATLAGEQVTVLETAPLLANEQGQLIPAYSRDTLHLNGEGYTVLSEELKRLLEQE